LGNKKVIFADIQQIWKKMQTNFDIFGVRNIKAFSIPTANKIFQVLFSCPGRLQPKLRQW